jgi:hypothetical protein
VERPAACVAYSRNQWSIGKIAAIAGDVAIRAPLMDGLEASALVS